MSEDLSKITPYRAAQLIQEEMNAPAPAVAPAKTLETPSEGPLQTPAEAPSSPSEPSPCPAPPPAAKIVLEGTKTERELVLERELKERETRLSELEDENRMLKTPPSPKPAPQKRHWLEGGTFFE